MKAKQMRIKRSPTLNPTTVTVHLDHDKDVILNAKGLPLAMSRDEARKLADLLTLVAEG